MQKWLALVIVVLAGVGGLSFWVQRRGTVDPHGWEYCTVGWSGATWNLGVPTGHGKVRYTVTASADICYAESDGCKRGVVTVTADVVAGSGGPAYFEGPARAQEDAVAEALAKLGAQGWELVGSGPDPSASLPATPQFPPALPVRNILYLKRPKP